MRDKKYKPTEESLTALCFLRGLGPWPEEQKGALTGGGGGPLAQRGPPWSFAQSLISLPVVTLSLPRCSEQSSERRCRKWLKKQLILTQSDREEVKPTLLVFSRVLNPQPPLHIMTRSHRTVFSPKQLQIGARSAFDRQSPRHQSLFVNLCQRCNFTGSLTCRSLQFHF